MKSYREFSPSQFDQKGLGLPDQQDWLVAPVSVNRDSDVLTESNWKVVTEDILSKGSDDAEIHRFGHWANGWFEILIVRPGSEAAKCAEEWESSLSDYCIASESDLSERELEAMNQYWKNMSRRERVELLSSNNLNIMAARRDEAPLQHESIFETLNNRIYQG